MMGTRGEEKAERPKPVHSPKLSQNNEYEGTRYGTGPKGTHDLSSQKE